MRSLRAIFGLTSNYSPFSTQELGDKSVNICVHEIAHTNSGEATNSWAFNDALKKIFQLAREEWMR